MINDSRPTALLAALALVPLLAWPAARADTQTDAYAAMGLEVGKVITGTVFTTRVLPGPAKQVVALTTYFTGKRERDDAVSVRLDVFRRSGDSLVSVLSRDYGVETGGLVADGDLQIVDLDMDGVNEIVVEYDATQAAREVPVERRDRFQREIDLANTIRTRGVTLFFTKTVVAVAGERLAQPKVVQETFPLKEPSSEGW